MWYTPARAHTILTVGLDVCGAQASDADGHDWIDDAPTFMGDDAPPVPNRVPDVHRMEVSASKMQYDETKLIGQGVFPMLNEQCETRAHTVCRVPCALTRLTCHAKRTMLITHTVCRVH